VTANANYKDGPEALPPSPPWTDAAPAEEPDSDLDAGDDGPALEPADGGVIERRRCLVAEGDHGERLDKLLARAAPEFSRSHLQGLVDRGHVRLDGQLCTQPSRRLRAGQQVDVELVPTAQALAFRPEIMDLPLVYEDEHLLVLDKPAGLVVHPGAGNWSGTLLNGLLAHHGPAAQLPRAGIVHRLDKGTSGLMVVGKTLTAVTELVRLIAAREVRREYLALVHGAFTPAEQRFEGPIARDPGSRLRMAVLASGKPARTDVRRIAQSEAVAALACRLHTGRTHQIRVHLAHAGHPLVSDALYGGAMGLDLQRPALHARRLAFVHPQRGEVLTFEAALPDDLARAWHRVAPDIPPP
jgi:23S rRNA pseudouridine1911/1915/1917 synthase